MIMPPKPVSGKEGENPVDQQLTSQAPGGLVPTSTKPVTEQPPTASEVQQTTAADYVRGILATTPVHEGTGHAPVVAAAASQAPTAAEAPSQPPTAGNAPKPKGSKVSRAAQAPKAATASQAPTASVAQALQKAPKKKKKKAHTAPQARQAFWGRMAGRPGRMAGGPGTGVMTGPPGNGEMAGGPGVGEMPGRGGMTQGPGTLESGGMSGKGEILTEPQEAPPNTRISLRMAMDVLLALGEYNLRTMNLVQKAFISSLSIVLLLLHSGELHVLSAQWTSKFGLVYTTSVSAFPIYFIARISSAAWKRPWIPNFVDAIMIFIACFNYFCMTISVALSLEYPFTNGLKRLLGIPKQRTKLNQAAALTRLLLTIIVFFLLLLEGLWKVLRLRLQRRLNAWIIKRRQTKAVRMSKTNRFHDN